MEFRMKAIIHRGNDYKNTLRTFQHKRVEFLEQEIRAFDANTLWLLIRQLCHNGRTLESITGLAV